MCVDVRSSEKMTEADSKATSHLFVVMTTTQTNQLQSTGADTVTSSPGAGFYFRCAVVVIGHVGAVANGLILYAIIASKQHKKQLLIFNQNVYDRCSSLVLVTTYTLKLCNIRLSGMLGYWLCMLIPSENLLWCSINGSVINLLSITVERYLKMVYPTRSNILLRKWVIWSAMVFAVRVDRRRGIQHGPWLVYHCRDRPSLLRVCGLEQSSGGSHPRCLELHNFLRHRGLFLHLLLRAHSVRHSSPGKCDGRSWWIKYRSSPFIPDPDQRGKNHDPCQRTVRRQCHATIHLLSARKRQDRLHAS